MKFRLYEKVPLIFKLIKSVMHGSVSSRMAGRPGRNTLTISNEPRYEKTGLRGLRPGLIQTGLCNH